MSFSVEDRLKRYAQDLDAAAEQRTSATEDARLESPVPVAVVVPTPPSRGRVKWLVATVCLVVVVGSAEMGVMNGKGRKPTGVAPASGSDWLVPGKIDGYHLWFAQSLQTGVSYPERYRMQLARPTPAGGYTHPITVTIGDKLHLLVPTDATGATRTTVDLHGQSAEIVEGSNSGRTVLQYELDDGDAVVFVDNSDPVSDETRRLLQSFAEVIKPADVGGLAIRGDLPAGYKLLAVMNMKQEFGAAPDLTFIGNDNRQSLLSIDTEASPPRGYEMFRITSEVEPVKVRGVTGWITTGADTPPDANRPGGSTTLFWREPTGQLMSINSSGPAGAAILSKSQLVVIADGLRPVSESEWQTLAQTAESTGEGVGAAAGPTQVAFPTPPAGYRLEFAHLDQTAKLYGQARYVSLQDPEHQPVIEVLLRRWGPGVWQSHLDGDLRDHQRGVANGRRIVYTTPGLSTSSPHPDGRAVAMEWIADVVVEVVVYSPNHAPLGDQYDDQALAQLANSVNGVDIFTPGPINPS